MPPAAFLKRVLTGRLRAAHVRPYGSIAFLRALTAHGRGGVKTPPYRMSFTAGL